MTRIRSILAVAMLALMAGTAASVMATPSEGQPAAPAAAAPAKAAPAAAAPVPTAANAPAAAAPAAAAAAMPTVDELVAKNTQARGGLEKIRSVQSVRMTGKQTMMGMEIPFLLQIKRPGEARMEATVQGMTMVQAYDGKTGWAIIPFQGSKDPQKMTEEQSKQLEEEADIDGPLVDYKAKGHSVELVGKEDLDGTAVYKIKLTLKNGSVRYIFLDAENFVELKSTMKRTGQGGEMEIEQYKSDFKSEGGLMMPHSIESRVQGQAVGSIIVQKVELNVVLDEAIFKMPATPEPPAAGAGDKGAEGDEPEAEAEEKVPKPAPKTLGKP